MSNRVLLPFVIGLLVIIIAVVVVLAVILHLGGGGSSSPTPTPAAGAITVHNDTSRAVDVQDCTGALNACAQSNSGTTRLQPGSSGTETGATGLRILDAQGHVIGCISLTGAQPGSTVNVSSAGSCPS